MRKWEMFVSWSLFSALITRRAFTSTGFLIRHPRAGGDPEQGRWEAKPGEHRHGPYDTPLSRIEIS